MDTELFAQLGAQWQGLLSLYAFAGIIALSLAGSETARLRLDAYLAVTSNTVQFGARADFFFGVGGFSVEGYLGFDTLFHFAPFSFIADLGASVALRSGGAVLLAVTLFANGVAVLLRNRFERSW